MILFTGTIAGPSPFLAPLRRTNEDGEAARRRKNGGLTFHILNWSTFTCQHTKWVGVSKKQAAMKVDCLVNFLIVCFYFEQRPFDDDYWMSATKAIQDSKSL